MALWGPNLLICCGNKIWLSKFLLRTGFSPRNHYLTGGALNYGSNHASNL
ncbi:hypothetical protein T01_11631 [Trichinella spiralis]|uniref:Uncharacterized protein n=1 Tax=Trichinella spiralis TaxID=6334 RepID=A0A0V1BGQ5_TRISP|nr:hypothetical protein T01_11631 [Trichinella spiralis]